MEQFPGHAGVVLEKPKLSCNRNRWGTLKGKKKPFYLCTSGRINKEGRHLLLYGQVILWQQIYLKWSIQHLLLVSVHNWISQDSAKKEFKKGRNNSENWSSLDSVSEILDPYVLPSTREINWGKSWLQRQSSLQAHMPCEQKLRKWGFSGETWQQPPPGCRGIKMGDPRYLQKCTVGHQDTMILSWNRGGFIYIKGKKNHQKVAEGWHMLHSLPWRFSRPGCTKGLAKPVWNQHWSWFRVGSWIGWPVRVPAKLNFFKTWS